MISWDSFWQGLMQFIIFALVLLMLTGLFRELFKGGFDSKDSK